MLLWQNTLDWGIVISHSPGVCEVQDDGWHQQVCCVASVVAYGRYLLVFSMEERQIRALGPHGPGDTEGQRVPVPPPPFSQYTDANVRSALLTPDSLKILSTPWSWISSPNLCGLERHTSVMEEILQYLCILNTLKIYFLLNSETSPIKLRFLHIECSDFWMIRGSECFFF